MIEISYYSKYFIFFILQRICEIEKVIMNQSVMNDLKKGVIQRILPSDIEIEPSMKQMNLIKKFQVQYQLSQLKNKSPIEVNNSNSILILKYHLQSNLVFYHQ